MARRWLIVATALAVTGCGSMPDSELPPPAGPAVSPPLAARPAGQVVPLGRAAPAPRRGVAIAGRGRKRAVLATRARRLDLFDTRTRRRVGSAAAGTGPANVASDGGNYLYVTDTKGGALLVFRIVPELHLTRRYPLPGAPYGIAHDPTRRMLWVTLTATNELVQLSAGARPRALRRFPAVRQPDGVAVEPRSGRVLVAGTADGVVQRLDPPPVPRSR